MLKAHHVSAAGAKKKSKFELPASFDGDVHKGSLYHAVRAFLSNQRQGTHSTKTRSEVTGGRKKPFKQKGTGRARQGTTRAAHFRGGGIVFGPKPRTHHVKLPRKVKQVAKQSALNARAVEEALYVVEPFNLETPKTKQILEFLEKLELDGQKVLVLTSGHKPEVYLSGRNLPNVHVMEFDHATAYEILWSDAVVIEEGAFESGEEKNNG
ncbi:MAG: 50S ribosomal protein L4 [Gemmatimonadota bacterium]|nr:50S ribosomal protein L4 [Gemmatimonadota bacterium]